MTAIETQPKITALLPYYGGKRTLAPRIVEAIGPHSSYWEIFCGSMAVVLAKPPCSHEAVNDLNNDVINFARVVSCEKAATLLHWRLERTLAHETIYREAIEQLRAPFNSEPGLNLDRAFQFFVASWLGLNGVTGTRTRPTFARRYTSNGGCPAVRFAAAVDSLPWWHERIRRVMIYRDCGIQLAERIEDKAGTVSYYDHPLLDSLYAGWSKIPLAAVKAMANAKRSTGGAAPEVLLINSDVRTSRVGTLPGF